MSRERLGISDSKYAFTESTQIIRNNLCYFIRIKRILVETWYFQMLCCLHCQTKCFSSTMQSRSLIDSWLYFKVPVRKIFEFSYIVHGSVYQSPINLFFKPIIVSNLLTCSFLSITTMPGSLSSFRTTL